MKRIAALILMVGAVTTLLAAPEGADGKRWWSYVEALANDQMQGRNTGSPEHRKAAEYVASQFERAGLKPAGVEGYIQPVKFDARKIVESQSSLDLIRNGRPEHLALGEDAVIALRIDPAESVEAPLVFAGYGLVVPEMKFDDLAGLDLKGKIIVTIAGGPSSIPGNLRAHYGYATERGRFLQQAGVVGMVTIQNPRTSDIPWARSSLARFQESMSLADPALVDLKDLKIAVTVNAAHADKWLAGSGHTLDELLALVDAGKPLPRFPLIPSLKAKVKVERRQVESQNVVASLPGSDPTLRNEYVVFTAHLDHLGVGEPINGDKIYNGAMDDASGVASLLEIVQTLRDRNATTRRSLLFVAVTGEEKGLLGSRYFAAHPTVNQGSMVADLNLDMFLPLYPLRLLTVYGLNESDLGDEARKVAKSMSVELQDDPAPQRNIFVRSDQYNFIRRGIPAVMIAFGNKKGSREEGIEQAWLKDRYHAPSDDLGQPIDPQAAAGYNRFMMTLAEAVANRAARPQWKSDSFFRRFSSAATAARETAGAKETPLVLKKIGNFFVGGEDKTLAPGSEITVGQMYVEYKIPASTTKVPVIMVHGCCLSSKSWQETPDGRMGWDEYFVRKGHPTYLADQVGRARSGFDAQVFNDVRAGTRPPTDLPRILWADHQFSWRVFRFGPSFGAVWPDEQFPVEHIDQLYKQMIPDLNAQLPAPNPTWTNMGKLAVQLGGAVLMGHSESGFFPARAAMLNAAGIKGLLLTEGTCLTTKSATTLTPTDIATLAKIPTLVLWGDHVASEDPGTPFGDCKIYTQIIKEAGGDITFTHLPKIGIFGNSHMFMLDKNNLQVADVVLKWLDEHVH